MNIAIIGLGLIGGSIAKDLRSQMQLQVFGVDNNHAHQKQALELGLVDEILSLEQAQQQADVLLIAIPVDAIEKLLPQMLDEVKPNQTIIDVGSTKAAICQAVANHPNRQRYVAAHPLAGTEYSGPAAALSHLFVGKKNIICEKEQSADDSLALAEQLFQSIGMHNVYMQANEHDKHLAYVSHLSHVSSFMLGMTVLDIEKDEKRILDLASTGFASTVRLAKSNPNTWSAIFDKNQEHLSTALGSYIQYLQAFKQAVDTGDKETAKQLMTEANAIKKILK